MSSSPLRSLYTVIPSCRYIRRLFIICPKTGNPFYIKPLIFLEGLKNDYSSVYSSQTNKLIFEIERLVPLGFHVFARHTLFSWASLQKPRRSASISSWNGAIPSHIAPFAAINAAQRPYKSSQNVRFVLYSVWVLVDAVHLLNRFVIRITDRIQWWHHYTVYRQCTVYLWGRTAYSSLIYVSRRRTNKLRVKIMLWINQWYDALKYLSSRLMRPRISVP